MRESLNRLAAICAVVLPDILRVGGILVIFVAIGEVGYRQLTPDVRRGIDRGDVEFHIVHQQMKRSLQKDSATVTIVGDSSCLMGIEVAELNRTAGIPKYKSLCTIGFVGPRGYAALVGRSAKANGGPPAKVLLFIHPVQFQREPSWEPWADMVVENPDQPTPTGLNHSRYYWQSLLHAILPSKSLSGAYGIYYGPKENFIAQVYASGDAIDPAMGLDIFPADFEGARPGDNYLPPRHLDYSSNELFLESLSTFRDGLLRNLVSPANTYVVIAPVPQKLDDSSRKALDHAKLVLSERLGLDRANVFCVVEELPSSYFSTQTHLNRYGKKAFTKLLVEELRKRGI
jgi:hypothetical protein